jgi:hypothetical protein
VHKSKCAPECGSRLRRDLGIKRLIRPSNQKVAPNAHPVSMISVRMIEFVSAGQLNHENAGEPPPS